MVSFRMKNLPRILLELLYVYVKNFLNYREEKLIVEVQHEDNLSLITTDSLKEKASDSLTDSYKKREM